MELLENTYLNFQKIKEEVDLEDLKNFIINLEVEIKTEMNQNKIKQKKKFVMEKIDKIKQNVNFI